MRITIIVLGFVFWSMGHSPALGQNQESEQDAEAKQSDSSSPKSDLLEDVRQKCEQEDWNGALESLDAVLREHPEGDHLQEARFWRGFCQEKIGDYVEAISSLSRFESDLAKDTWADDALLHLGYARRYNSDPEAAIKTWRQLLEDWPHSIWRTEAWEQLIDVHFNEQHDLERTHLACQGMLDEATDPDADDEPRYLGAYCLNALHRYDEAVQWEEKWLPADDAEKQGWAMVLLAQREILQGESAQAMERLQKLDETFPDFDFGTRLSLIVRGISMLRNHKHGDEARQLIVRELQRSQGQAEYQIEQLLEELRSLEGDKITAQIAGLEELSSDQSFPLMTRVVIRDQLCQRLREDGQAERAAERLRDALDSEESEFARFKSAMLLAELTADDLENVDEAIQLLNRTAKQLTRRDLVTAIKQRLIETREAGEEKKKEAEEERREQQEQSAAEHDDKVDDDDDDGEVKGDDKDEDKDVEKQEIEEKDDDDADDDEEEDSVQQANVEFVPAAPTGTIKNASSVPGN